MAEEVVVMVVEVKVTLGAPRVWGFSLSAFEPWRSSPLEQPLFS
jgi:hypothetical protein